MRSKQTTSADFAQPTWLGLPAEAVKRFLAVYRAVLAPATDLFASVARPRFTNVSGKALAAGSSPDLPAASALPLAEECPSETILNWQTQPGGKTSGATDFVCQNHPLCWPPVPALLSVLLLLVAVAGCGCDTPFSPGATQARLDDAIGDRQEGPRASNQDAQSDSDASNGLPRRLERGEVPEEWVEPQRERVFSIDANSDKLDLTFDDLKFDIEVGQPFERELLSEEVKSLDGKQVTLSGYMRPSFKASGLKGFIFVRDDKECCFGPQAAIYDCVRVKLKNGSDSDYIVRPFKVRGTFFLKEREGPDGAIWSIFNMKNATIES